MSYQDLLDECSRDGIGPLFWTVFRDVVDRTCHRYPPEVYNTAGSWSEEAINDLVQDVYLHRLIEENQLAYVLTMATDEGPLRGLLAFQVRRTLAHRKSVTVVDRLVKRVAKLASEGPEFRIYELSYDSFITLVAGGRERGDLAEAEIRRGSGVIHSIPRLATSAAAKRESKVYHKEDLCQILRLLVATFDGISLRDIRKILENSLTAWLPTILYEYEEDWVDRSGPELEVARSEMTGIVKKFAANLDPDLRVTLLGKAHGLADGKIAGCLSYSRPLVAKHKGEVLKMLKEDLIAHLPPCLIDEATRLLLDELVILEDQDEDE